MVSRRTLSGNINIIPQFADMLQYLIIQLCDTSTSFCHYDNGKLEPRLIGLDDLKKGIKFAMKQNLMIQFLYPDYVLPEQYKEVINSIDHNDIVSSTCEDTMLRDNADIVVMSDWTALSYYDFKDDSIYVLRTSKADLFDRYQFIKDTLKKVYRLNIVLTDIDSFNESDYKKYNQILSVLADEVAESFNHGNGVQLNVLTDRIVLNRMNNCEAGNSHLTLAPDGKLYVCPAFYAEHKDGKNEKYPEYEYCIGEPQNDNVIPNANLYKLEYSPLCRTCDAYQCKRCVWLSKKLTLEVNTPSHEQCVVSHLERNMSRDLLEKIRNSNENLSGIEIPAIDYLDPFDNRKEW